MLSLTLCVEVEHLITTLFVMLDVMSAALLMSVLPSLYLIDRAETLVLSHLKGNYFVIVFDLLNPNLLIPR